MKNVESRKTRQQSTVEHGKTLESAEKQSWGSWKGKNEVDNQPFRRKNSKNPKKIISSKIFGRKIGNWTVNARKGLKKFFTPKSVEKSGENWCEGPFSVNILNSTGAVADIGALADAGGHGLSIPLEKPKKKIEKRSRTVVLRSKMAVFAIFARFS